MNNKIIYEYLKENKETEILNKIDRFMKYADKYNDVISYLTILNWTLYNDDNFKNTEIYFKNEEMLKNLKKINFYKIQFYDLFFARLKYELRIYNEYYLKYNKNKQYNEEIKKIKNKINIIIELINKQ